VSEQIINGTSAQLRYSTVPFTPVYAGNT